MKNTVFTIVFSLLFIGTSISQDIYYGPKAGINVTHLMYSGDEATNLNDISKMKVASHYGVFVEILFSEFLTVQPELLYSIKGARMFDTEDDLFESNRVFKYISMPIVVKYYFTEKMSFEIGPQVAYLLSAKDIATNRSIPTNSSNGYTSDDIIDNTQRFDFGATAGLGYLMESGFYISARYNFGILNSFKNTADFNTIMHNGAAQLSFGFSFQ